MNDKATIKHRLKDLEKNRDKYYENYQVNGSASAMRTFEKYDDLCDICNLALRACDEEDAEKVRRQKNMNNFIDNFKEGSSYSRGKTYSADEVVEILHRFSMTV